ncbi:MAG: hypothetical protein ACPGVG_18130 [Mycobacterium sp.]
MEANKINLPVPSDFRVDVLREDKHFLVFDANGVILGLLNRRPVRGDAVWDFDDVLLGDGWCWNVNADEMLASLEARAAADRACLIAAAAKLREAALELKHAHDLESDRAAGAKHADAIRMVHAALV